MSYYCKKSGRYFKSEASLRNHLRSIYYSTEEAYLSENNVKEKPKCLFCNINNTRFISFKRGYHIRCDELECRKKHITYSNRLIAKNKIINRTEKEHKTFCNYINDNKKFYLDNYNNENIIEPFFNKNIGKLSLRTFIRRRLNDEEYKKLFIEEIKCTVCNKKFYFNI
jgi:hypothetical protein